MATPPSSTPRSRPSSPTLKRSYEELGKEDREPIDYRNPATRFAYVYKYTAAHGDYVVQALEAARNEVGSNLFTGEALRLSCIGGGPGSDVVGVLRYLSEHSREPVKKLTCYLLDGEQGWADTWTEVGDSMEEELGMNVNFQKLDVTDPESWSAQKRFLKANLFTLSYFVSEVYSMDTGAITKFWKKMFDEASSGALFLYVDNGSPKFNAYFDSQWTSRGDVEAILQQTNKRITPSGAEQKSEIAEYSAKFAHSPKLQATITTRVLRKK